ncbi:hypothetical protein OQ496_11500 [Acetobacter suratthaniensis]|uniref:Uncharacterized protein n=1 Tax=Acetobacter suratthaniensis TaxID=1502841 RepID=A0ABS3LNJ7_9PROT|nr:hypothetical protein [Acetobacter suratthaniensis]MBO1328927.1 hypothetical protein [Acetobacter suratthaniensis]MCX2567076.1 hypothetical protein [Acetobacter suratthaniensis]
MANHAYTMPGKCLAVLTLARLHGDALAAIGAASLCVLALAGALHPEHLQAPSGQQAHYTQPRHKPAKLYMACLLPKTEVAE